MGYSSRSFLKCLDTSKSKYSVMAVVMLFIWANVNVACREGTRRLSKNLQVHTWYSVKVNKYRPLVLFLADKSLALREDICNAAVKLGKLINYKSAGRARRLALIQLVNLDDRHCRVYCG